MLAITKLKDRLSQRLEDSARMVFLSPAILLVLFLSVFPLLVSLYLAFSRVQFVRGGFEITYIKLKNFEKLLKGSEERHFIGKLVEPSLIWQGIFVLFVAALVYLVLLRYLKPVPYGRAGYFVREISVVSAAVMAYIVPAKATAQSLNGLAVVDLLGRYEENSMFWRGIAIVSIALLLYLFAARYLWGLNFNPIGTALRVFSVVFSGCLFWIIVITSSPDGLPGTLVVTMIFVFAGVTIQYVLGLGLALLVTQNLPGKRFFRVIFLLPMMITPVGIGFLFRMITDTLKGPLSPIWIALGLADFSWVQSPFGARMAVIIGDTWQWTPFVFIILLAALEGTSPDQIEAALVDGANRIEMFRFIILPQVLPVSTTVILIRLIESFKIIDLPQVLTYGGPGTATESVTLHAYNAWRSLDLGLSAAIAYLLLFVATFITLFYVNVIRSTILERL